MTVDASPFDLGDASGPAALCLHGLTGTPYEVRPLAEALAARGVRALGPSLPGHDTTPRDLAATCCEQWLESARKHYRELRDRHEIVFVVGLSLGGLLSLALAAEERIDALAVVGTPLRFSRSVRWLVPCLKTVHPFLRKRGGSDIRDERARARHPGYDVMPLACVHEVLRLQRRVVAGLERVTAPILVAHGAHDQTANPRDAQAIFDGVSSTRKETLILEESAHVCPVDHDGPALAAAAAEFLTQSM